jgi:hypothetical protein
MHSHIVIQRTVRPSSLLGALCGAALLLAGCREPASPVLEVAMVEISGAPGSATPEGDTVRLGVTARSGSGEVLTGLAATWSSGDTTVATVDSTGMVVTRRPGTAAIAVQVEGRAATVSIMVGPPRPLSWTVQQQALTGADLRALWAASERDIFAAGGEVVLHWDGAAWKVALRVSGLNFIALSGRSSSDVFATSREGAIYHFDGSAWSRLPGGSSYFLGPVWVASDSTAFAANFFVYDGSDWKLHLPYGFDPQRVALGVWGASASKAFAVGQQGSIYRWDGDNWVPEVSGTTRTLRSVWGSSGSSVYAAGDAGTLLHYDGSSWSSVSTGVDDDLSIVWGTSDRDIYVLGNTLLHFDGTSWKRLATGTKAQVAAIGGAPGGTVWLAGAYGTLARLDGSTAREVESGAGLYGVWGSSGANAYAAGDLGVLLRYDGSSWRGVESGTDAALRGVWGSSERDVFAVGARGTILHFDGSAWRLMASGTTADLQAVYGSSANDVYASGGGGTLLHYDGADWRPVSITRTTNLSFYTYTGLWSRSPTEAYASGHAIQTSAHSQFQIYTLIARFDGTRWTETVVTSGSDQAQQTTAPGIWGAPGGELFATGYPRKALHFDGSQWAIQETNAELRGVWGTSNRDVYAVGSAIFHFDGTSWSSAAPSSALLNGVWGSSARQLFAVGAARTIVRGTR